MPDRNWWWGGGSGGAPFNPAAVSGALGLYLFDDGSGTTLTDQSGNGNHGTLAAIAAAPAWSNGGLTFDGGDYVTLPTSIGSVKYVHYFGTETTSNGYNVVLSSDAAGGLSWGLDANGGEAPPRPFFWVGGVGVGQQGVYDTYNRPGGNGAAWTQDGTLDRVYANGKPCYVSAATAGAGGSQSASTGRTGGLLIGYNPGNTNLPGFYGTMTGLFLGSAVPSDATIAQMEAYFWSRPNAPAAYANIATGRQITVVGDSISTNAVVTTAWPTTANAAYANQPYTLSNLAVAGRTLGIMGTAFRSRVLQRRAAVATKDVIVWFIGTNDIYVDGTSPTATFALLNTAAQECRDAGFLQVVVPMLSRTSSGAAWTATTMDAAKNTYNGLVATLAGPTVRVVPLAALAGLIEDGAHAGGNFQDGTHPTQSATTNIIAPAVVAEVDAFG